MLNSATYWVLAEGETRGMLVAIGMSLIASRMAARSSDAVR